MAREVEVNTRLVKLHLQWPDRKKHLGSDQEAIEFFKYLFLNFHMDRDVAAFEGVDEIETFLQKNARLLNAKPSVKKAKSRNGRVEPRIANDAQVMLNLSNGKGAEVFGATFNGKALDVGLHGLQVSLERNVPQGAQVELILTTSAGDRYELQVETRWSRDTETGQLLGLRILETNGFARWQAEFGAKFVAPLARQHKAVKHETGR